MYNYKYITAVKELLEILKSLPENATIETEGQEGIRLYYVKEVSTICFDVPYKN